MSDYVLDASAVLALLNQEPGSGLVQEALPRAVISTVNLSEIVARLAAQGMPEDEIREVFALLALESIFFDEESAVRTGLLFTSTRNAGLSLGDRACLNLAASRNGAAITADRGWKDLQIPIEVRLIRP